MLQWTGPKSYNIRLRKYVKDRGYLLNQHGIFKNGKKIAIDFKTEKDIINFIGTTYYEPSKRH